MGLLGLLGDGGQVTLPKSVRRALGLKAGDRVRFQPVAHGVFIERVSGARGASARGVAAPAGAAARDGAPASEADRRAASRAESALRGLAALRGGLGADD